MDNNYSFSLTTQFVPAVQPGDTISSPAFWFIFQGEKLLMQSGNDTLTICIRSPEQLGLHPIVDQYLGRYGSTDCFMVEISAPAPPPKGFSFHDLRSLFGRVDDDLFTLAGKAVQTLHYFREHRFCGKCGTAMENRKTELAKICPACGFISFSRLSPAVIMSITQGDQILLARAPRFPAGMYSTLAGFVEPGETLEEAVKREIREEVNIRVSKISYVASQPWPFPHSIMIGFSAIYASGEIQIDDHEIEDAKWFSKNDLPRLPSRITIARLLIDNFINTC